MNENNNVIEIIYDKLTLWIEDVKQHEVTNMVDVIAHAKALALAAETLPEEKVKQFINNLRYDFHQFYLHYQSDMDNSIFIGLMNESLWAKLAQMTDKSQVEWCEFYEDIQHEGQYSSGEYIGFGELECKQCHDKSSFLRFSKINNCQHCNGSHFIRNAFRP
jgi:hypothetical protein